VSFVDKVSGLTKVLPSRILRKLPAKKKVLSTLESIQQCKGKGKSMIKIFLFSVAIFFVQAFAYYFFFIGMGINISYFQAFALLWIPLYIGRFSSVPGGLGVREGSMIYMLYLIGIDISTGTILSVLLRIIMSASFIAVGMAISLKTGISILNSGSKRVTDSNVGHIAHTVKIGINYINKVCITCTR
jgi:uncharacterized protein (TIRG00374 family)